METREITIRVDERAARAYATASAEERRKIDLLLSLRLGEVTSESAPLDQVMREIARTPERVGPEDPAFS